MRVLICRRDINTAKEYFMKSIFKVFGILLLAGMTILNSCASTSGGSSEKYYKLALQYLEIRDYYNALSFLNMVIANNPNHVGAYVNRGNIYLYYAAQEGNYGYKERALNEYKKAIEIDPNSDQASYLNYMIGSIYRDDKKNDSALSYFKRAIEIDPSNNKATEAITELEAEIAKIEAEREAERLALTEFINGVQANIERQFGNINQDQYEFIPPGAGFAARMGMGSPVEVGKKYNAAVFYGMDTRYGAAFTDSLTNFIDPDKKVPEGVNRLSPMMIYFTVTRRSGTDIYISLEYIEFDSSTRLLK